MAVALVGVLLHTVVAHTHAKDHRIHHTAAAVHTQTKDHEIDLHIVAHIRMNYQNL